MLFKRLATRILASHLALAAIALMAVAVLVPGLTRVTLVAVALGLAAAAALFTVGLTRLLTEPVTRLAGSVQRITRGDLVARAPEPVAEEFAGLASSLNSMANELRTRIEQVADERDRARQILETLENGVIVIDIDGALTFANPAARSWLALTDDHTGMAARRVLGVTELSQLVDATAATGSPGDAQVTVVFPEYRILQVRTFPLVERQLRTGVVVNLVDLTDQHRLAALRRDFVANASHELKTPVAAIRALSEGALSALEDDDTGTATHFLGRAEREAERLDRLVRDLLDLSRVERGGLAVEPVDLTALAREVTGRYADRAIDRGLDLRLDLDPDVVVRGDQAHLGLLVSNLIDNALRYTPAGGRVEVRVRRGGDGVGVQVADTGRGIPSRELDRVFERFYRIDKSRDRSSGGTGLGLAIVRHVAESHGGGVTVDSELGRGTTFTVTLPPAAPATPAAVAQRPEGQPAGR